MSEKNSVELLNQLEHILDSDPLIDEVGFIHPSQFVALNADAGGLFPSSDGTVHQQENGVMGSRGSKFSPSGMVFWCRDHKLGISTEALLPLYNAAKCAFMAAYERYKACNKVCAKNNGSGGSDMSSYFSSSLDILESEVMKHSKGLLLLSCDFGTAWNSRKLVLSNWQHFQMYVDELFLSALVLSYAPKSECSWSHRRWVIKMIAGRFSDLQEIVEKESELVQNIAEKSKMNYRAWNHRCWLVSYMTRGQVLHELNKSRDWTGLHIADSSCFHYRTRLILRMLEDSCEKQNQIALSPYNVELSQMWKEELDWNETLINRYVGREALWLYRRFLSLGWIKHFSTNICDLSVHSDHKDATNQEIAIFMDRELGLFHSCSSIPDNQFEDFQAQAIFSATYILWLTKQISEILGIKLQGKLPASELMTTVSEICPEKIFLWHSFQDE